MVLLLDKSSSVLIKGTFHIRIARSKSYRTNTGKHKYASCHSLCLCYCGCLCLHDIHTLLRLFFCNGLIYVCHVSILPR